MVDGMLLLRMVRRGARWRECVGSALISSFAFCASCTSGCMCASCFGVSLRRHLLHSTRLGLSFVKQRPQFAQYPCTPPQKQQQTTPGERAAHSACIAREETVGARALTSSERLGCVIALSALLLLSRLRTTQSEWRVSAQLTGACDACALIALLFLSVCCSPVAYSSDEVIGGKRSVLLRFNWESLFLICLHLARATHEEIPRLSKTLGKAPASVPLPAESLARQRLLTKRGALDQLTRLWLARRACSEREPEQRRNVLR